MFLFFAYVLIGILFWKVRNLSLELERRVWTTLVPAPSPVVERPDPVIVREPDSPAPPVFERPREMPKPVTPRPSLHAESTSEMFGKMAEATGGWEQLIGGNLLNKLGALVLVIGIALFLSYSFANMGPAGRAFTSLGISGALLAGGVALERKEQYRLFSRGILAAGWAALYFTAYAMHALPAAQIIESPVLGTGLMLAVAAGMVGHSLRYKAQSLTALSYGCIFAALALSSLNTFVAISLIPLAASMLYLARRFEWHAMALFAAAATYGVFLTRPASDATLASIQMMLVLFWILFEAFDVLRIRSLVKRTEFDAALFGINALAGLGASAMLWQRMSPDNIWQFCAGAAALYLTSTWLRFALDGETYYEFALTISSILAGLAVFARVPGLWISIGMMLEAELLFLAGWRLRIEVAKLLSWVAFLAAAKNILEAVWVTPGTQIALGFTVENATPALVLLAGLFCLNRYLAKDEPFWSYFASAVAAFAIGLETRPPEPIGIAWLAFAAGLFEFGLRKQLQEFRFQGYALATLSTAAIAVITLNDPQGVSPWIYAVGIVYFFGQALRATQWLSGLPEWERQLLRFGGSSGTTLFTGFLIHRVVPTPYEALALMGASVLLLELALRNRPVELLRPALLMNGIALLRLLMTHADGIQKSPETAVWISFAGAAAAYFGWMLRFLRGTRQEQMLARFASALMGCGLALTTLWMVLPAVWVPVAFAALMVIVAEVGLFAEAEDISALGRTLSATSILALVAEAPADLWPRVAVSFAIAGFQFLLHFRNRRQPHFFIHGCIAAVIIAVTLFNEASGGMLTLSWSLEGIALLAAGFLARDRWLRLPGLSLLLICIGKIFFYDLRNLETMYRILSFIGLGLILLGVSWIYTRFKEQLQKLL